MLDPVLLSPPPQSLCSPSGLTQDALNKCWREWGFLVSFPVPEEDSSFLCILFHPAFPFLLSVSLSPVSHSPMDNLECPLGVSFAVQRSMVHRCGWGREDCLPALSEMCSSLFPAVPEFSSGKLWKFHKAKSENPCSSPMVRLQIRKQNPKEPEWTNQATDL